MLGEVLTGRTSSTPGVTPRTICYHWPDLNAFIVLSIILVFLKHVEYFLLVCLIIVLFSVPFIFKMLSCGILILVFYMINLLERFLNFYGSHMGKTNLLFPQ